MTLPFLASSGIELLYQSKNNASSPVARHSNKLMCKHALLQRQNPSYLRGKDSVNGQLDYGLKYHRVVRNRSIQHIDLPLLFFIYWICILERLAGHRP